MYTPEDSPFEKFRTEKLKGVAMSPDALELVAKAYEVGFIDGMQKQMQSSVDRAVNRMAEQPAQQALDRMAECKFDREQKWVRCEIAHHNLVQSEPHNWPGYQTRLLYTSPQPAQRTWVGLSEGEVRRLYKTSTGFNFYGGSALTSFIEAIEAKLKEKNT